MKKIISILAGIEIGILLTIFVFLTLIGYVVTGILSSLFGLVLPVEHELLQVFFGYLIAIVLVSLSVFICVKLSSKLYKFFKWIVIVLPIFTVIIYLAYFKPIDKFSEIQQELEKYKIVDRGISQNYWNYFKSFESKLNKIAVKETPTSNLYLGIFSTNQEAVDSIIIDTLFISTDQQIGLCVFTMKQDDYYKSVSTFFNPKENRVYSGYSNLNQYGDSRDEALVNLYYQLYIERKERKKAIYSPEYKTWTEKVSTVLDPDYWTTTLKEDTINMKEYGSL